MTAAEFDSQLSRALQRIAAEIYRAPYVKKVILFGSYSKRTNNDQSDVDLAVFIEDGSEDIFNEFRRVALLCVDCGFDIQPQVFYESELVEPVGIIEEIVAFGTELKP